MLITPVSDDARRCAEEQTKSKCLDGGFFVFGDLSVRLEGEFRLRFGLFEMKKFVKL